MENSGSAEDAASKKIQAWILTEKGLGTNFNDIREVQRLIDYSAEVYLDRDYGLVGPIPDFCEADWTSREATLLRQARLDAAASRAYAKAAHSEAFIARRVSVKTYYVCIIALTMIALNLYAIWW